MNKNSSKPFLIYYDIFGVDINVYWIYIYIYWIYSFHQNDSAAHPSKPPGKVWQGATELPTSVQQQIIQAASLDPR